MVVVKHEVAFIIIIMMITRSSIADLGFPFTYVSHCQQSNHVAMMVVAGGVLLHGAPGEKKQEQPSPHRLESLVKCLHLVAVAYTSVRPGFTTTKARESNATHVGTDGRGDVRGQEGYGRVLVSTLNG